MIVSSARSYVGTKFAPHGRSRRGIDCAGLIVLVARDLGVPCADVQKYPMVESDLLLLNSLRKSFCEIRRRDEIGSILSFRTNYTEHAGILVGRRRIVHAWRRKKEVVESEMPENFESSISGAFSFLEARRG